MCKENQDIDVQGKSWTTDLSLRGWIDFGLGLEWDLEFDRICDTAVIGKGRCDKDNAQKEMGYYHRIKLIKQNLMTIFLQVDTVCPNIVKFLLAGASWEVHTVKRRALLWEQPYGTFSSSPDSNATWWSLLESTMKRRVSLGEQKIKNQKNLRRTAIWHFFFSPAHPACRNSSSNVRLFCSEMRKAIE